MCCQEFVQNVLMQSVYFADHLQNTQTACGLFDFEDFFLKMKRSITFIHDNFKKNRLKETKKSKGRYCVVGNYLTELMFAILFK